MEEERAAETPVRMFRTCDGLRVELVDVTESSDAWRGCLFRPVRFGPTVYPKGTPWTVVKDDCCWTGE